MSIRTFCLAMVKSFSGRGARRSRRRDWTAAIVEGLEQRTLLSAFTEFADPNPSAGNRFGATVVALSTGNVVITSPFDDAGGSNAGAVYLFNGSTGELISTLTGSHADDNIGAYGVTALSNGNFVVVSTDWDNGAATDAGAVTWGSGMTGVSGIVSAANSLVGSQAFDRVGIVGVTTLSNGNYVVSSPNWANNTLLMAGAATWGDGATGVSGAVSQTNSLFGTQNGDQVGRFVTALNNGNFAVGSPEWDNGSSIDAGAVTWGNGSTGLAGPVSSLNSLVGGYDADYVGQGGSITGLSNGHFVVSTPTLHRLVEGNVLADVGGVTWVNGTTGTSGGISLSNSLLGNTAGDGVGRYVTALTNGNYVVTSPDWDNEELLPVDYHLAEDVGAVTWGNGATGTSGLVSAANSLIGDYFQDQVGIGGVTALSNGNYVVSSPFWDNGGPEELVGAVTWANGTTGLIGAVAPSNSLTGSQFGDSIGNGGVTALSNGNYVVASPSWSHGGISQAGAATFGNGASGTTGIVSTSNSIYGGQSDDRISSFGVTALANGNYVVISPEWKNGTAIAAGAVTWGNGSSGTAGQVTVSNSLVGGQSNDRVGLVGATPLSNGNYVVSSPDWNFSGAGAVGAVTWGNGVTGVTGIVSPTNSLVGSTDGDQIGQYGSVQELDNGDYVVSSIAWDHGTTSDAGAVTLGSGTTGITGPVSPVNSTIGQSSDSLLDINVVSDPVNSNYFIRFLNEGSGRVLVQPQLFVPPPPVTFAIAGNKLNVTGSDENDTITVLNDAGLIKINANGVIIDTTALAASVQAVTISGMGGDDTLTLDASLGTLLLGTLLGGNGNDTLISGLGNDTLDGGADIDTASYTQATVGVRVNLSLATIQTTVGAGKDKLLGFENLTGSNWNDSLTGDSQNNVLAGGNGNDTLVGGAGRDSFYGDGGNDSFAIDSTDSGVGNLAGVVRGGEGIDTVTIAAGSGAVQLNLTSGQIESVVASASTMNNRFRAAGAKWAVTITGGSGADLIEGGEMADRLTGGGGDDELVGNGGNDTLTGGLGADQYSGGDGNDSFTIDSADTLLAGGNGIDTVTVASGSSSISLDLAAGYIESVNAAASAANNTFDASAATWAVSIIGGSGDDTIIGGTLNDKLIGGWGNDLLSGGNGNDSINGGLGNDTIHGQGGNDLINGDGGADELHGNTGNDSLTIDGNDTGVYGDEDLDKVMVATGSGVVHLYLVPGAIETVTATVSTANNVFDATGATWAVSITGGSGNDTIIGGILNDTLTGGAGDDSLTGGDGNDALTGGLGADSLIGDGGNDALKFDNLDISVIGGAGLDTATVNAPTGAVSLNLFVGEIETVSASVSTFNNLFDATGTTWAVSISGGSGNDTIIGGNLNDTLNGGAGDDSLSGGDGNDALTGGLGADSLIGDGGNDALKFDNLDISVIGGAGLDTATVTAPTGAVSLNLFVGEIETVSASVSTFNNIFDATGATWAVAVTGGSGNDTLIGGLLNDKLTGGAGNDLLIGGDGNDTLSGGDGVDTISYSKTSGSVSVNLTTKKSTGAAGNDAIATIENVIGSPFADTINGDLLNNLLNGGDLILGNDTILGAGGIDSIINA